MIKKIKFQTQISTKEIKSIIYKVLQEMMVNSKKQTGQFSSSTIENLKKKIEINYSDNRIDTNTKLKLYNSLKMWKTV